MIIKEQISNIKIEKIPNGQDGLIGYVSFVINNCINIHGLKIYNLNNNIKIIYPLHPVKSNTKGKPYYVVRPINEEARLLIHNLIVEQLEKNK